jgi:hypothetical protein
LHAKDGKQRQSSGDASRRPRNVRAVVASLAVVAGVGTFLAARRAFSKLYPSSQLTKRRAAPEVTADDLRLQQLTRYRAADGTQSIRGTLLAEFEPGDRISTLYIAFCPPFERLPTVESDIVDDSDATVKLLQLMHNGVQFEVRLPQSPDEKHAVTIELLATDSPLVS